jgi:hypothetical protein
MNDEEYQHKLSQVAEFTIPEVNSAGNDKPLKRGRKTKEEQYQLEHEEVFLDLFDGKNPTIHPVLTKVKIQACVCNDCGKYCAHGRHTETTKYFSSRPHWRARCLTCGMNQNPNTGEWDLTNKDASAHWANWLRKTGSTPYQYKQRKTITIQLEQKQDN